MSCRSETKNLTVRFIYASRILNIDQDIVVCKDDTINKIYSDINNRLLINHKKDSKVIYFLLYCNQKLCKLNLTKTFDEVFGISPYVINVILTKEFFNTDNLLKATAIKSSVDKKTTLNLPEGLEEISKHEFFEDIEKGHLEKKIIHLHGALLGNFLKFKVEEDHLLVKIANHYLETIGRKDMITENIVTLLTEEINNKEIQIGDKKYLLYYLRDFSIKQLKALLPKNEKTSKFLKDYLVKNEKYGCKINHPSCQFETKFRAILVESEDSFKKFIDFIDTNYNLESFMNMSFFPKYLDKAQKLLIRPDYKEVDLADKFYQKLGEPKSQTQHTLLVGAGIGDKLNNQTGGDLANFKNVRRLLEISGEPLHDFANKPILNQVGPEKQTKIVAFWLKEHVINKNRENLGTATGEIDCWKELGGIFKSKQIFIDTAGGINSGNHEDRYLKKIMDNSEFHLTDNVIVKDRFKFYKYESDTKKFMQKVGKSGVSQEYTDIFAHIKDLLKEDGINHLLYDQGKLSELRNYLGEGEEDSVNTITTATKLWDPSPGSVDKHIADLETYKGDPVFQRTLQSLFMSNLGDINTTVCPLANIEDDEDAEYSIMSALFEEDRTAWTPIREDLREYYSVTYNFDIAKNMEEKGKGKKLSDTVLKLTLKDSPLGGVNISGGLSINDLIVILYFTEKKQDLKDKNDGELKKELKKYKLDNIPNNALEAAVYILKNFWKEDLWRDDEKFHIRRRILLDMKKSGDWGLVNWVRLNNKCNSENHKTILFSGDRLCGLMGMCSDIPVLSNGSAVAEMVEWESTNTFLYYTGTSPPVTSVDLTAKVENSHTLLQEILGKNHQFKDEYKMLLTHHSDIKKEFTEANTLFSKDTGDNSKLNKAKSLQILFAEVADIIIRLINVPDLTDTNIGDTTQNIYELLVTYTMGYNHIGLSTKEGQITTTVHDEVKKALDKIIPGEIPNYDIDFKHVGSTQRTSKADAELFNLLRDEYKKLVTIENGAGCFLDTRRTNMANSSSALFGKGDPGSKELKDKRRIFFMNHLTDIIRLLTTGASSNYNKIFIDFPKKINDIIEDTKNLPNDVNIYDTTVLKESLTDIVQHINDKVLSAVEKNNREARCDGKMCGNIQDNFRKIRKIYNCIYDAFIATTSTDYDEDSATAEFFKTIDDSSEYMRILIGFIHRPEKEGEDKEAVEETVAEAVEEAVEETVAEAVEDAGEDKDAGRLESLDPLVVALQVDEDDLNINNIYGIPTKVNVGDVLGILDGCEEVVEGYPESEIVGLGQVISIETDNTAEGSKSKFIKFRVLTPFKQLEDNTNLAKGAVASYEYVYFRHISQRSLEDIILPEEKPGIEVYNSSLPETDVVYKKSLNNNELVLIMGEGNRKAGIGVINKHNGDYTLDIIILTEFEADDTAYGIWGPVDMINVEYHDIKLITPEDILGREFILEPERRE